MRFALLLYLLPVALFAVVLLAPAALAAPGFRSVEVLTPEVAAYGLFELRAAVDAQFTNPYDPDDVRVEAVFTGPGGEEYRVAGFWYIPYFRSTGATGVAVPLRQPGEFRVRFAPPRPGVWQYSLALYLSGRPVAVTGPASFTVEESASRGFIRIGDFPRAGFRYDDGTPFFGIGVNLAWWDRNPGDYDRWIPMLAEQGVNLIRLWMSPWSFGIEWQPGHLGHYDHRQEQAAQLDYVLALADRYGIKVLLVLINHGQFSTNVDAQWAGNPYNAANGGFLNEPHEFFTHPQAIDLFQRRLRYIVARWGHHPSILAWELWNEVNLTTGYAGEPVARWHETMSEFLRSIDPYGHLITTSFSNAQLEPSVWRLPHIDFTMTHFYNVSDMAATLLSLDGMKRAAYGKPTFSAEFGVSLDKARFDREGVFLHNGLWAGLFSPGAATPMSWWWNNYLEPNGLFHHFGSLTRFLDHTVSPVFLAEPVQVRARDGGQGNVLISTTLGWGGLPDETDFILHPDGTATVPLEVAAYIMGSVYNTHLRRAPLRFHLEGEAPARFGVLVEDVAGSGAVLQIRIDGQDVLTQSLSRGSFAPGTLIAVDVPEGARLIEVDNTGLDWLRISGYVLEGLASQSRAFGVQDAGDVVVWVQDRNHTYAGVVSGYEPTPIEDARLRFDDITAGWYDVLWWDTWKGVPIREERIYLEPGTWLDVPPFLRDVAARLRLVSPPPERS